jgi:DNA helicase-2/ATP-dependent DNA helicase PcrA
VCVVGDPSQTIYSFTGASPQHLLDFARRHPGARTIRLVRDYRSTPQVVGLANALLGAGTHRSGPNAPPAPLELVAQRPAGPPPGLSGYDDDVAEAAAVGAEVGRLIGSGVRASEIAVLFRTNAQSQPLEAALADAGVAYLLRGGERFFGRREVREAVLLLRGAARSSDGEEPLGEQVRAVLTAAGWTPQPPASGGAVRERWESLQALAGLADEVAGSRPQAGLGDLVTELDERASAQHAPTVEGVTLASLHAAKGLEWDAVFIVGLSDGLMPISLADGWAEVEEERRLLYVGVTRAREHLQLSWARARTPGARSTRNPSRFLDGLLGSQRRPAASASGGRERGRRGRALPTVCRVCGARLAGAAERKIGRCDACPPTYDEQLFARLKEWRSRTAAEAKLPAYVVFTDATLVAIAEATPADESALAAVPGVGPAKLTRYGPDVLAMLAPAADPAE